MQHHPIHVVTNWLGNTTQVAMKHYLMTTDADFERALVAACEPLETSRDKVAQKAAQYMHAGGGKLSQAIPLAHEKTPVFPGYANICDVMPNRQIAAEGKLSIYKLPFFQCFWHISL